MKPIFVRIILFDPGTGKEFEVFDGVEVAIARASGHNSMDWFDVLPLNREEQIKAYSANAPGDRTSKSHYFRVDFYKPNYSEPMERLLAPDEVTKEAAPIYCPSRLPYWDSGWDDDYETNEFFNDDDVLFDSSAVKLLPLRIPLRVPYNIGHRGAPHFYPENTVASFQRSLDIGANGIEFDLCLTKDERIIVFHDPKPVKHPTQHDRTVIEGLPYELVSPDFSRDGNYALIKQFRNGDYETVEKIPMQSAHDFDIIRLTLDEVRWSYRYRHVKGVEHEIPELDDVLELAKNEGSRLQLLFFDVKNPGWDEDKDQEKFVKYGEILGEKLRHYPGLPRRLIISNVNETVLTCLKKGIAKTGEDRCEFAYDAEGGLVELFDPFRISPLRKNPLRMARKMDNSVVSIGSLLRPGSLDEIIEAAKDRDYNKKSKLTTVIHWTLNEPSQMYLSFTLGVNGIVTDKPDELRKILAGVKVNVC
jgi:glycerophosphoryl diester phosphodiesterase